MWKRSVVVLALGLVGADCMCSRDRDREGKEPVAQTPASPLPQETTPKRDSAEDNAQRMFAQGRSTFRLDTFGDEAFWGGSIRLHDAIQGEQRGGVGSGVTPRAALTLGLKLDSEALPVGVAAQLRAGRAELDTVETMLELLRQDAIVGVRAFFSTEDPKRLRAIGVTCAFCHSTVDDSIAPGVGRRLDGWPNRDLNIGAIVARSPDLSVLSGLLSVDDAGVRKVLASWGPGKYDAMLLLDGKAFRPDGRSAATVLPPVFGLAGIGLQTWTGWGSVPYWNALVANTQMRGKGVFFEPRLDDKVRYPLAAKHKLGRLRAERDEITGKLAALHLYQLALPAPKPPVGSYDPARSIRGDALFNGAARCATCHMPPLYTEPGWNLHEPKEIGIDDFQAKRSPTGRYRTAPLRGLFAHPKGGFYHDGRFATLLDVVAHYNKTFKLGLDGEQQADLVEFLKSI